MPSQGIGLKEEGAVAFCVHLCTFAVSHSGRIRSVPFCGQRCRENSMVPEDPAQVGDATLTLRRVVRQAVRESKFLNGTGSYGVYVSACCASPFVVKDMFPKSLSLA